MYIADSEDKMDCFQDVWLWDFPMVPPDIKAEINPMKKEVDIKPEVPVKLEATLGTDEEFLAFLERPLLFEDVQQLLEMEESVQSSQAQFGQEDDLDITLTVLESVQQQESLVKVEPLEPEQYLQQQLQQQHQSLQQHNLLYPSHSMKTESYSGHELAYTTAHSYPVGHDAGYYSEVSSPTSSLSSSSSSSQSSSSSFSSLSPPSSLEDAYEDLSFDVFSQRHIDAILRGVVSTTKRDVSSMCSDVIKQEEFSDEDADVMSSDGDSLPEGGMTPDSTAQKDRPKRRRGQHLWEFVIEVLRDPRYNPSLIRWIDRERGLFKIVKSQQVARLWGQRKRNPTMSYEYMSRAMRHYYNNGILNRVFGKRLVYQFGPMSFGWRENEPLPSAATAATVYRS